MIKGERLRELRRSRGITQEKLGEIIGVTKASICCYEKGTRTPTLENLLDLVVYFGVSADYLIGSEVFVTLKDKTNKNYVMTKEEIEFMKELRKNKYLASVLLEDPNRGIELLNKKIG